MFLPVFVCLSLCLSVCLSVCEQDYSKRRALIWIKCCMSTDCRNMDELTNVLKFRVAAPIRYRRKQSGSGIRTIRIGLKS